MTAHYSFPTIVTIDDVLPHIAGCPEFIVVDKGDYTVINYVMMGKDTFPTVMVHDEYSLSAAVRRECRGLIFDKDGNILARRFHKFFNLGERDDLQIDLTKPHHVLRKMDGSMISAIVLPGGDVRWTTKMGITDVAMQAEVFVATRPTYARLAKEMSALGMTAIFEWCSRQQRIVLDYPEDTLVLLAIRDNESGLYLARYSVESLARDAGIPVVPPVYITTFAGGWAETIRAQEDVEGIVLCFDDGTMVKVKTDWYVQIHRAKSLIENERDVVGVILDNKVDDLLPVLPAEDADHLRLFEDAVWKDISDFTLHVIERRENLEAGGISRRDFAIATDGGVEEPLLRSAIFHCWDIPGSSRFILVHAWVVATIRRKLGSRKAFADASSILLTAHWAGGQWA